MDHRYLGSESEIHVKGRAISLDSLGQKVKLEEAEAANAQDGGCVVIPEAEYTKTGITPAEEKQYRWPGSRSGPGAAEIRAKIAKGIAIYHRICAERSMGIAPSVLAGFTDAAAQPAEEKK